MSNHTTILKGNIPLDQCGCLKVRFENTQDYKALINHNGTPTASVCGGKDVTLGLNNKQIKLTIQQ